MAVPTTIMSSRPSAAILIISPSSMSGPCGLFTQGPRIAHLSSDAELKIGSHVAEPSHTSARCEDRASYGNCRLARCSMRLAVTVAADMGGQLVCPAPRHRTLRQLAELVAYTGLTSEGRDLAGRGARVTSLTEIGLPEQTTRQGT